MALETGTYINSLNASNPVSTDGLSQADDHLRLIKSTIKSTFPNIDGAVTSTEDDLNIVSGASAAGVTAAEFQHLNGVTSAIQTQLGFVVPTGGLLMWTGAVNAVPTGWLLCDGSEVSQTTYADLYAVIGSTFGTPVTNTNFILPNLVDKFVAGVGSSGTYSVGTTGGADSVTLTTSQIPAHNHTATSTSTVTDPGHSHTYVGQAGNGGSGTNRPSQTTTRTTDPATTGITVATTTSIANTGGDSSHENRPPFVAMGYIIKT
jgi:microcystin-dependent protein